MKIFACGLLLLQFVHFGAAQCADGWDDKDGQCMRCSSTITGTSSSTFAQAENYCVSNSANLATVITQAQEDFAISCASGGTAPWFGYTTLPFTGFIDGIKFVDFGSILTTGGTGTPNCWQLASRAAWNEANTNCDGPAPFVCSRLYEKSCSDLEMSGVTAVTYDHADTSTPATGTKWMGTTATYSCNTGYSVSGGDNPRTCTSDGSWNGTAPECVASAVCAALTEPSDSTISYSATASGTSYTIGTVATQVCDTGYNKKSGTDFRTCQSSGAWTESAIECEKENTDNLAIGLGLGLGVPLAMALGVILFLMCRRTPILPRPAPIPRPVAYPRPTFRPPYPRRMGPRPFF